MSAAFSMQPLRNATSACVWPRTLPQLLSEVRFSTDMTARLLIAREVQCKYIDSGVAGPRLAVHGRLFM